MKKKLLLAGALFAASTAFVQAQDTTKAVDPGLTFFGSVDTYYKYDFAGKKNSRIGTSFASEANSVSIGMIDLGVKKKYSKALFVGELSFGPRGQAQSLPNADGVYDEQTNSFHIQNLYVGYDLTDKLNVTAGYMSTFVGYEVISPVGNFNYSTSYMFTNGPFQNAGIKFTYAFSDKVSLMAGVFNDYWNIYQSSREVSTFGSQLMVSPVKGWTAYINLLTGKFSGTEVDLTTSYQVTDAFKLGLNAASYSAPGDNSGGFAGVALYPQLAVSSAVTFGLRAEYFKNKANTGFAYSNIPAGDNVKAFTLTANVKAGGLTFIPEVRLDNAKNSTFTKLDGTTSKSAGQFALAAVYAF